MSDFCQRCGSEPAVNVQSTRVYEGNDYTHRDLCEFCRRLPRSADPTQGLAILGNLIVQIMREERK